MKHAHLNPPTFKTAALVAASLLGSFSFAQAAVTSKGILDGTIKSEDFATRAINADRFVLDAITSAEIAAGAIGSGYILVHAASLGAARPTLLRMAVNIGVDMLAGSVPVLGDIFDVGFRANERNLGLLEGHMLAPVQRRRGDLAVVLAVGGGAVGREYSPLPARRWRYAVALLELAGLTTGGRDLRIVASDPEALIARLELAATRAKATPAHYAAHLPDFARPALLQKSRAV